ncbi:hypothetical protein H4219_005708 [Mycoemilia scoparia]|uniref:Uncharacterized protein n=1 Tax=Mycoemilia scoparia TaxID=417184 RepID=A0A9W8DKK9_9FUNG|nr:hypothetical protein H4219_005708 [Mycoemilia scoparia]
MPSLSLIPFHKSNNNGINNKPALIVFGDGLSDAGNKQAIFGLQAYWKGRFTNGPVWNEYASQIMGLPLVNYAVGGATSSNTPLVSSNKDGRLVPSLLDQVDAFLNNNPRIVHPERNIVSLNIGANNIREAYFSNINQCINNQHAIINGIVKDIEAAILKLFASGYTQIVVWNILPFWEAPRISALDSGKDIIKNMVTRANILISKKVEELVNLNGHKIRYLGMFDAVTACSIAVRDPQILRALGITHATTACINSACGMYGADIKNSSNSDEHFYLDLIHLSTRVHYMLGILFSHLVFCPRKIAKYELLDFLNYYGVAETTSENNLVVDANNRLEHERALITFGDSTSDVGNKEAIFGQKAYWRGRFSNGPVWNEYAAQILGLPLVNYAVGGATSSNTALVNDTRNGELIPSLLDQVDAFLKNNTNVSQPEDDIVSIYIGANNLWLPLLVDPNYFLTNEDALVSGIVDDIEMAVMKLLDSGYSQIVVWNFPQLWDTPEVLAHPRRRPILRRAFIRTDDLILKMVDKLSKVHKNKIKFLKVFDALTIFTKTIKDPEILDTLGITDTTTVCVNSDSGMYKPDLPVCSNDAEYFYYDRVHNTTRVHQMLGIIISCFISNASELTKHELIALLKHYRVNETTAENNPIVNNNIVNSPSFGS